MLFNKRLVVMCFAFLVIALVSTIVAQAAHSYLKVNCYETTDCRGTSTIWLTSFQVKGFHDSYTSPSNTQIDVNVRGQLWKDGGVEDSCGWDPGYGQTDCRTVEYYFSGDDGTTWFATSDHEFQVPTFQVFVGTSKSIEITIVA